MHLQYRSLSECNPPYPRKGNLWGWSQWIGEGLGYMAKVDLWLGASPRPDQVVALRQINPHIRILTSINAVENQGLPSDYYLKDIHGNRIEVWPGSYRLNLTKPYVADYQARYAYQTLLDTGLMPGSRSRPFNCSASRLISPTACLTPRAQPSTESAANRRSPAQRQVQAGAPKSNFLL